MMKKLKFSFLLLASLVFFVACSKKAPDSGSSASFSFTLPKDFAGNSAQSGVGCFAVSISGQGLESTPASSCDQSYGLFAGLTPLGGTIEIETMPGSARTIDVFYVISDIGCQPVNPTQGLGQVYGADRVFKIGTVAGVQFTANMPPVDILIEYPRSSNSLATLVNAPASCLKGPNPISLAQVKQARVVQGSSSTLPGGVATTPDGSQMRVRVYDQKIDLNFPNTFTGRLVPVRLGDE
jgi:hypothetical protein